jgi:ribosomal protein S18 acetylase RimI-like enzyme
VIRPARCEDAESVVGLWRCLVETHAVLDAAFALRSDASLRLERAVTRALVDPDVGVWVSERSGERLGFCAACLERSDALAAETRRAAITELYVRPDARRQGRGRALVDAALAWAREHGAARVEVRVAARNAAGQAFWRAQGFGDFVDVLDRRL